MRYSFILLIFVILKIQSFSQSATITNIRVEDKNDQMIIYYDINNPKNDNCIVTLIMRKTNDNNFKYQPRFISGDVGEGDFNGKNKIIVWDKKKEKLPFINIKDYYFDIDVKIISTNKKTWLWIGAGAAILGGGTALYFLLKKDKNETIQTDMTLPQPPGRP